MLPDPTFCVLIKSKEERLKCNDILEKFNIHDLITNDVTDTEYYVFYRNIGTEKRKDWTSSWGDVGYTLAKKEREYKSMKVINTLNDLEYYLRCGDNTQLELDL